MSGKLKHDSRYRTVQRESGRVFVTWFGTKFSQPHGSTIPVGAEVELLGGSTMQAAVVRQRSDLFAWGPSLVPETWPYAGIVGGEANRHRVEVDWTKLQRELGNPAPVLPQSTTLPVAKAAPSIKEGLGTFGVLLNLARDFNCVNREVTEMELTFRTEDEAASFRAAAAKKGMQPSLTADPRVVKVRPQKA